MDPTISKHPLAGTIFLLALACRQPSAPAFTAAPRDFKPAAHEMVQPGGFPSLYKWMLASDLGAAHWLGARVHGKALVEPLNVVIVDRRAKSAVDARISLERALAQAGFPMRRGHSGGYLAFVDGRLHPQLPWRANHAFSDEPFELPNDHGRVFGPVAMGNRYVFVAAFSRESIAPLEKVKHRYVSFNRARDRVADRLDERSEFKRRGFVDFQNHLVEDPVHSTGDHDGLAVLLERD